MDAIILSVGDELVLGQTVDTNSAWISQRLAAHGVNILAHATVPDAQTEVERMIRTLAPRCDVLIISGGIGPTPDDLTRQALAAVMEVPLEPDAAWLRRLEAFFKARGRDMPEMNKIQALIPQGARLIENNNGTAAGIHAVLYLHRRKLEAETEAFSRMFGGQAAERREDHRRNLKEEWEQVKANMRDLPRERVDIFVLPGVPKEMMRMFDEAVLPVIAQSAAGGAIISRTLHTFGLGESAIAEKLGALMDRDRNPSVGTTVAGGVVSLRINSRFLSRDRAIQEADTTQRECGQILGDLIYGQDDQSLPALVAEMLRERNLTVATAESCTGGLLAKYLTDLPGSSAFFREGWITYSNEAKSARLAVPAALIAAHGAVSEPVAIAMAQGARAASGADFALSITGVAGPDGGTPQKPVGTVYLGIATPQGVAGRLFNSFGDREMIRDRSAKMALTLLRFALLGKPVPF